MAGLDGNLIVFITFWLAALNWISMDVLREFAMKTYFAVQPTADRDTVQFFVGIFGQMQGCVALILLGCFVLPNCKNPAANCVDGETTPKELLIFIALYYLGGACNLAIMLVTKTAAGLGMATQALFVWVGINTVLGVLTVISAADAPELTDDIVLYVIVAIAVTAIGIVKGAMVKVDRPKAATDAAAAPGEAKAEAEPEAAPKAQA
eukprot:SAG22_NODE_2031_length_3108_cov_5.278166_1_plen_207_part_00